MHSSAYSLLEANEKNKIPFGHSLIIFFVSDDVNGPINILPGEDFAAIILSSSFLFEYLFMLSWMLLIFFLYK